MPPSQLKQLKASLKDHGVLGPQKSKKERKRATGKGGGNTEKKLARQAALEGIRERFNPFEVKAPARKAKFDVTSARTINGTSGKGIQGRPGVTKGLGEQRRRETLLTELHRKNKVGGILDRRFGEDDPNLTPEQRAAERYARESERRLKKSSLFNLEDGEDEFQLTHGGRSIEFGADGEQDDFEESDLDDENTAGSQDENGDGPRKRMRLSLAEDDDAEEEGSDNQEVPDRPKTKKEVMEELIAKSKMHRYERQQLKEDDDALRAELDKGLPEFFALMRGYKKAPEPALTRPSDSTALMNPERAALLLGNDRQTADDAYNSRVRQMAMDQRSKPSERTRTEEERLEEGAERLRELERERLKRMRGEEDDEDRDHLAEGHDGGGDDDYDDAEAFGLAPPDNISDKRPELDVEDEDEFVIDEDLVASGADSDISFSEEEESEEEEMDDEDNDDEFIAGLKLPEGGGTIASKVDIPPQDGLAFTYPCPVTHEQLLKITKDTKINDLPIVVQRIRALYHPKLGAENKPKLEAFCKVLVEHVAYLSRQPIRPPSTVLEALLRHLHSLAKSFPLPVGLAFREQLVSISEDRPLSLDAGDLMLLTGVLHIFPTSDHFHSVVTPSLLTIGRYLSQSSISSIGDLAKGLYCVTIALEYQRISKRYIPEVMLYLLNTLLLLSPVEFENQSAIVPHRASTTNLRIQHAATFDKGPTHFWDLLANNGNDDDTSKASLFALSLDLLDEATIVWSTASAFPEIVLPACTALDHLLSQPCKKHLPPPLVSQTKTLFSALQGRLTQSVSTRKPLTLHNHRPLAIKMSIPKFEEGFNPDHHYDPDRDRAEMSKLKAEHKKERKGAMRELRKDANFIARQQLQEKKERDAAYEKKYRRLIAEIQGEEGREAKEYNKEKRKRQGKW